MRKLVFAIILCLVFMTAEIVGNVVFVFPKYAMLLQNLPQWILKKCLNLLCAGGVLSRSLAIATDAAHLLTDLISFVISLFAVYIGSRAPTKRMSFGYYRAGYSKISYKLYVENI